MNNNGETAEDNRDSGVLSNPLSFLHSGSFVWYGASLNLRGSYGFYWLLQSTNTTYSGYLRLDDKYLSPLNGNDRANGFAVRCVVSLPILYVQKAGNYLLTKVTNPSPLSLLLAIL